MSCRKISLLIICVLGFISSSFAQHRIEFNIENYDNDSLIIGNYLMDKQLVKDTLLSESKGKFVLNDSLKNGVYLVLTFPDKQFLQFLVNDFELEFSMDFDYADKSEVIFEGSEDNQSFQSYVDYLNIKRTESDSIRVLLGEIRESGQDLSVYEDQMASINKEVVLMQDSLIKANPEFMGTLLLKANKEIQVPEFEKTNEGKLAQYHYYKKHYFDFIDLSDPNSLHTPFLFTRINYYINKLTFNHPDSISVSLDSILNWLAPSEESYQYYLSHFLNHYFQSKIVGYDAVYVHLADNYYAKSKATWASEETVLKIMDKANKLRPVLLGVIGEDIKVFGEDGTPVSISEIDYEYLVLLFWAPDCGHCKKTMPEFIEFAENYKELGVKVFAICTKYREKTKNCWEYVKEKNMHGFINAADEFNRSDFKIKYYVSSTPKVYILDKNREIIMKNIGANQLERVFEQIFTKKENNLSESDQ